MKQEDRIAASPDFDPAHIRDIAEAWKMREGALLPVLHAINERFGYIDRRGVPVIADALNLSRAEVHGVVSFYRDFGSTPPRRRVVRICRAEACQAMGAERVYAEVETACAARSDVALEPVYCLGNCALSPAALVDGKLYGRIDPARVLDLVEP